MKTQKVILVLGVLLSILSGVALASTAQVVDFGARYHVQHSEFLALPYGDGDLTYAVGYEIHEANSMIQLICGYTPEFQDNETLDYAISPEFNLLAKDGIFQGGLGILSTYMSNVNGKTDWMDMYWQFVLGLNIPLGKSLSLQANAYYVYESWADISNFHPEDIEFAGYLGYKF